MSTNKSTSDRSFDLNNPYALYPILSASILDRFIFLCLTLTSIVFVFFFQTDYEGQIKTLTQYIDPKTDGIIVAGGDGSLLEVKKQNDTFYFNRLSVKKIKLGRLTDVSFSKESVTIKRY